jgi:3-oxoadipate enol-lactonase
MTAVPFFSMLGDGPTVLMLHGIGGGHDAFAPQLEALGCQGHRAISWDMPGYGRSAPVEPYTFKALAQSCVALIEALKVPQVVLVGHSMGGMVAQEVAARRPDLVSRLVLAGTSSAFGNGDGTWQREFIATRTAPLDAGQSMEQLAQRLVPQMIGPGASPEGVALAQRCMGAVPAATYRKALEALVTFDRREALARISVPTLLLAGEFDKTAAPAVMQRMAQKIAGSEYHELRNVGHLMPLEAPDEFSRVLLQFIRRKPALAGGLIA